MGSSGGGFKIGSGAQEILQKLRESEEQTRDQKFETEVSGLINELLTDYNNRDTDLIKTHIKTIKEALEKEIDDSVDLLYGGSVAKRTYVDGLSDIDMLVLLNDSSLADMSPEQVQKYFYKRMKERLPKTKIKPGKLAVTIKFSDAEIQILPAIKHKSGYRIPDPSGTSWSFIKPKEFTAKLTEVNQKVGRKVIPTIKLAKSIISRLPEKQQLSGYHIEALAVEIFKHYDGPKTNKTMIKHFFLEAPKYVRKPIKDITGQSYHVDNYLGNENSLERQIVADALGRIGRRMQNADWARLVQQWSDILGGEKS